MLQCKITYLCVRRIGRLEEKNLCPNYRGRSNATTAKKNPVYKIIYYFSKLKNIPAFTLLLTQLISKLYHSKTE